MKILFVKLLFMPWSCDAPCKMFSKEEWREVMIDVWLLLKWRYKDELTQILDDLVKEEPVIPREIKLAILKSAKKTDVNIEDFLNSKECESTDLTILETACKLYCKYYLEMDWNIDVSWTLNQYSTFSRFDKLSSELKLLYLEEKYWLKHTHVNTYNDLYSNRFDEIKELFEGFSKWKSKNVIKNIYERFANHNFQRTLDNKETLDKIVSRLSHNEVALENFSNHDVSGSIIEKWNYIDDIVCLLLNSGTLLEVFMWNKSIWALNENEYKSLWLTIKNSLGNDEGFLCNLLGNPDISALLDNFSTKDNWFVFDKKQISYEWLSNAAINKIAWSKLMYPLLINGDISENFKKLIFILDGNQILTLIGSENILGILMLEDKYFEYLLISIEEYWYQPNFKDSNFIKEIKRNCIWSELTDIWL